MLWFFFKNNNFTKEWFNYLSPQSPWYVRVSPKHPRHCFEQSSHPLSAWQTPCQRSWWCRNLRQQARKQQLHPKKGNHEGIDKVLGIISRPKWVGIGYSGYLTIHLILTGLFSNTFKGGLPCSTKNAVFWGFSKNFRAFSLILLLFFLKKNGGVKGYGVFYLSVYLG